MAHVPAEVRVGLTPRRAIKFNKCPSKVRTLRVNVQLKHRPEPGKACSPCLQNVTESGMATITVNLKIRGGPAIALPAPNWNCGVVSAKGSRGVVYNRTVAYKVQCLKDKNGKCEVAIQGTRLGRRKVKAYVTIDVRWCKKRPDTCRYGRFRNNACTLDWDARPVFTTKKKTVTITCPKKKKKKPRRQNL